MKRVLSLALACVLSAAALPASAQMLSVTATDQDVSAGSVMAGEIVTTADGWLVVHRVTEEGKPGQVVGHTVLKAGSNMNVTATLDEPVASGDKLMLMIHGEDGGMKAGEFEYYLGAKEDGPIRVDGNFTAAIITAM